MPIRINLCGTVTLERTAFGRALIFLAMAGAPLLVAPAAWGSANLVWANATQGSGGVERVNMAVDGAGNVLVTGTFEGTVDFNPGSGTTNLSSPGLPSAFVQKLDSQGNLVWARGFGSSELVAYSFGYGIAVDGAGNVYIVGSFFGEVDFDPGPGTSVLSATSGSEYGFALKLDANGDFVWARALRSNPSVSPYAVAVDGSGNVHIGGMFSGEVDFDPGSGQVLRQTDPFMFQGFVLKLTSNGNFSWVRTLGDDTSDASVAAIAVDDVGGVYTAGQFSGSLDFNPGTGTTLLQGSPLATGFAWKLNSSGNLAWARVLDGDEFTSGQAIAVDSARRVYLSGLVLSSSIFDGFKRGRDELWKDLKQNDSDLFDAGFWKFDAAGNPAWTRTISWTDESQGGVAAFGVAVDASQNVYASGAFQGTVDFNPGAGQYLLSAPSGAEAAFLLRLSANGELAWVRDIAGNNATANAWAIAIDPAGSVLTAGDFSGTVDFDPSPITFNLTSSPLLSGFAAKYSRDDVAPIGLRGTVFGVDSGMPLTCAAVELTNASGQEFVSVADLSGEYYFELLPAGRYSIRVFAPGFETLSPGAVTLTGTDERLLDFDLVPASSGPFLSGRVSQIASFNAVPGARVDLFLDGDFYATAFTCADGSYAIPLDAKQSGSFEARLDFDHPFYETQSATLTVNPAVGATDADAELDKSVLGPNALAGRVLGKRGSGSNTPIAGAEVVLTQGGRQEIRSTNAEGLFEFDSLLDARYSWRASAAGYESSIPRTVDFARTSYYEPDIVLEPLEEIPVLSLPTSQVEFGASGGNRSITVSNTGTGTLSWSVSINSGASWLRLERRPGDDHFSLTATENTGSTSREGIVRVTSGNATNSPVDIQVTQAAASGGADCFIATAAYGSPMATELTALRQWRDHTLLQTHAGSAFVDMYYRLSPPLAEWVAERAWIAAMVRVMLLPLVWVLTASWAEVMLLVSAAVAAAGLAWPRRRAGSQRLT